MKRRCEQYGVFALISKVIAAVFITSASVSADPLKIVAMGDSLTQGYGLLQEDGFVPQLEGWLKAQGADIQLVNAGVSGDTTAGGASRVAWSLEPGTSAMIVALGGNDMLRGIDPAASKANLAGILQQTEAQGIDVLLVGMTAPGNFGPDYKARFDDMYPELAEEYGALLAPSFFEGLGSLDPAEVQPLMQADGIHPNPQGVAKIVEGLGPYVLDLIAQADEADAG